ncbi:MAG: 4-hydroxy-3-methylbut-2-enyl diphosphate reductase [Candidatus Glassbacteria bacterium]
MKTAGFCWGVKRALSMISEAAAHTKGPLYSIGPVIHNPQTVERLRSELGMKVIDSINDITGGTVVVRTHGVGPAVVEEARSKGLEVLDATCPFVSKIQEYARMLTREGYNLIIIGERNHPEVSGIIAHAGGKVRVIENAEDVKSLGNYKRAGVVVQSTQEEESVRDIVAALLPKVGELRLFNTICNATLSRQSETRQLAREVELMVVVGGRNSGNTRRLVDICKQTGVKTIHIEDGSELDQVWLDGVERIGITAGASTPDSVLAAVIKSIKEASDRAGS